MTRKMQRIMVSNDFSEHSKHALNYAAALAWELDAEVRLVHVVESSPYEVYQKSGLLHSVPILERAAAAVPRAVQNYIILDVMEQTRDQMTALASEKMKYRVQVRHGHVVDERLQEIEAYQPHLVIMCTHGWSGFKQFVWGSVVEKLVRLSPVLTFRARGE